MIAVYFLCFFMWIGICIFYFNTRWHRHLESKGRNRGAIYITRSIYLKVHSDGVIYSLFKKDREVADNVLEFSNGVFKTKFVTIFGTITLNRLTKKIEINEERGV